MTIKSTIFKNFEIFLTQSYISLFMPTHIIMISTKDTYMDSFNIRLVNTKHFM